MATTVNWITGEIFVPRADMPIVQVSPEIRELDTALFFTDLKDLEASAEGAPWPDTQRHNLEYTISGLVFVQSIEVIAPYFLTLEDGLYRVQLKGSNNNLAEVATANSVGILSANSAGLIDVPITDADKADIVNRVFQRVIENGETFEQAFRLVRAEAAGSVVKTGNLHEIKSADGAKNRIEANADETGRTVNVTDGT